MRAYNQEYHRQSGWNRGEKPRSIPHDIVLNSIAGSEIDGTDNRVRWSDIIANEPLGGTNIGPLTGATGGNVAMATGTTATIANTLWLSRRAGTGSQSTAARPSHHHNIRGRLTI